MGDAESKLVMQSVHRCINFCIAHQELERIVNLFVNPALCHIDRISHKCHVAQMSHCINTTNYQNLTCCESVTMAKMSRQYGIYVFTESLQIYHVAEMSRQCCKYVLTNQLLKCHCCKNVTSSVIKMSRCSNTTDPPTWENDPPTWEIAPWELVWPPWELILDAPDGK